jgi:hypothetical protein
MQGRIIVAGMDAKGELATIWGFGCSNGWAVIL